MATTVGDALREVQATIRAVCSGPIRSGGAGTNLSAADSMFAIHKARQRLQEIRNAVADLSKITAPWGAPDGKATRQVLAELSSVAAMQTRRDAMKHGLQSMVGGQSVLSALRSVLPSEMSRQTALLAIEPIVRATGYLIKQGYELELTAAKADDGSGTDPDLLDGEPPQAPMDDGSASSSAEGAAPAEGAHHKIELSIGHVSFAVELVLRVEAPARDPRSELLGEASASWESASFLVLQEASNCKISGATASKDSTAASGAGAPMSSDEGEGGAAGMKGEDDEDDEDGVLSTEHLDAAALEAARSGDWVRIAGTLRRELRRHEVATAMATETGASVPLLPHVDEGALETGDGVTSDGASAPGGGSRPPRCSLTAEGVEVAAGRSHAADVRLSSSVTSAEEEEAGSGRAQAALMAWSARRTNTEGTAGDSAGSSSSSSSAEDPARAGGLLRGAATGAGRVSDGAGRTAAAWVTAAIGSGAVFRRSPAECAAPARGVLAYGTRPGGVGAALQLRNPVATTVGIARLGLRPAGGGGAAGGKREHEHEHEQEGRSGGVDSGSVARLAAPPSVLRRCQRDGWVDCSHLVCDQGTTPARVQVLTWVGQRAGEGSGAAAGAGKGQEGGEPATKRARIAGDASFSGAIPVIRSIDLGLVRPGAETEGRGSPADWSREAGRGLRERACGGPLEAAEAAEALAAVLRSGMAAGSCVVGEQWEGLGGLAAGLGVRVFAVLLGGAGQGGAEGLLAEVGLIIVAVARDKADTGGAGTGSSGVGVGVLGRLSLQLDGGRPAGSVRFVKVERGRLEEWIGSCSGSEGGFPGEGLGGGFGARWDEAVRGGGEEVEIGSEALVRESGSAVLWSLPRAVAAIAAAALSK